MNDDPGHSRLILLAALVVAGTFAAARLLRDAMAVDGLSLAETGILAVFSITFAWLGYGFWTALAGFAVQVRRRRAAHVLQPALLPPPADARTALLVPIFHEATDAVAARLEAIVRSLADTGQLALFDVFILSDSRDPDRIREEQAVWLRLRAAGLADGRIYYRNRRDNSGRKAGNIAEFCRRWGRRYPYFVVLDADSVMAGETLVHLVGLMEANPRAGLIQTLPRPVGGQTLFARILQFSASLCGPMFAAGFAHWFPGRSNYWGHNAIIRTSAFMTSAGLPVLPGAPPLGGEIMSHDFVEAALLQRAGWSVWLVPDLGGSYEELPPTLGDYVQRDRRWCQGNLQHLRVLVAKGLRPVSRFHLAMGVMAYVASLLWLLLLVLTTVEAIRSQLWSPPAMAHFSRMFPAWPVPDQGGLMVLAWLTVTMLLLPKLLALGLALGDATQRRAFGGGLRLARAAVAEVVFSVLLAPILMIQHSKAVLGILLGRGVGWGAQQRSGRTEGWRAALATYGELTLLAALWGLVIWLLAPGLLLWFSPVLAGLALAVPLAVLSSRSDLGLAARRRGWFLIPEECRSPPELVALAESAATSPGNHPAPVRRTRPTGRRPRQRSVPA